MLERAFQILLAIDDIPEATRVMKRLASTGAPEQQEILVRLRVLLADAMTRRSDCETPKQLEDEVTTIAADGLRLVAYSILARCYERTGERQRADEYYGRVLQEWKALRDPRSDETATDGAPVIGPSRVAPDAVAEALFHVAEREATERLASQAFPESEGLSTRDEVLAFVKTEVKAWYESRRQAIAAVAPLYKPIVDLDPQPSPEWSIAALWRVGSYWADFVEDFMTIPLPASWAGKPDLSAAYREALAGAMRPFRRQASGFFQLCLQHSRAHHYVDERARSCEQRLAAMSAEH